MLQWEPKKEKKKKKLNSDYLAANRAQLQISEGKARHFRLLLTGDDQTNAYLYVLY
jgi:hypothetical protein